MKYWIVLTAAFLVLTGSASAAQFTLPDALLEASPETADLISNNSEGIDLAGSIAVIWKKSIAKCKTWLLSGARCTASLAAGVLLLGAVESILGDGKKLTAKYTTAVGALWITAVSAGDISGLMGLGRETIGEVAAFSKVLLPSLSAATAAAGSTTAASVRQVATVFFSDLLLTVIDGLLLPLVYLYIGVSAAGAVLDTGTMESIGKLLKKGVTWCLTGLVTAFTAYLTVSGAIAGSVDRQTLRAAKAAVSGAVPVVGRILAEAAESVLAGASLLRGVIGTFGTLALVSLCLTPFLRLLTQYLLYQAAGLIADAAGPKKLAALIAQLGDAFALVLAMTGASALIIMVSLISALTGVTG